RLKLLRQCCASLGISADFEQPALVNRVQQLDGLTPGDAAAALRRVSISGEPPSVDLLLDVLAAECRYKPTAHQPIGFVH
ncbi:MAG: hypothetical protein ABI351_13015, partial [Herbaspirillum sp.]